ncbi:MAG TPA: mechanosensitive ion channel family protein [Longimicrobiales bacterium]|nr:mechanosensitive ion channel family protein [Longimicrobiales bacterium]
MTLQVPRPPLAPGSDTVLATIDWQRIFRLEEVARNALRIAIVLVVAFLAYRIVRLVTNRIIHRPVEEEDPLVKRLREQRAQTVGSLLNSVAGAVIAVVATITVLSAIGVPIASILASVGVVGLAISFGAQSLVKDVITGTFLLLEGQFGIGDVVKIADTSGLVERITLRTTVLRDTYGTVHVIPNGTITKVSNLTKSWSRAVLDVGVAYREDVDRVIALMKQIGAEFLADPEWGPLLLEEPTVPGVENLGESAVIIRMMAKTLPLKQWDVARELRRRIKIRFDQEGIEIPFPTITFYWGEGQMPPALETPGALSLGETTERPR